jgi:hypothetical protein
MAAALSLGLAACLPLRGPAKMTLNFSIKPLPARNALAITLIIDHPPRAVDLRLYKQASAVSEIRCSDGRGNGIQWADRGGYLEISTRAAKSPVRIAYTAALGKPGRHGHAGAVYSDLVVFDGEHALLLPEEALTGSDSAMAACISRISVTCDVPADWTAIVPFPSAAVTRGKATSVVTSPTFFAIYTLAKSCYAYGKFEELPIAGSKAAIAVDPKVRAACSEKFGRNVAFLFAYYANLFACEPAAFSLVLLRSDAADGIPIMGGVGAWGVASTLDPDRMRDWQLLSHRLFHAFFDGRMPLSLFHKKPQLWLYEGLATWYENVALRALPADVRATLGIDARESFAALCRRYLFMRLVDSTQYALAPMNEPAIASEAAIEFLHYTQAPLVVKLLEDQGCARFGGSDRILRFIMSNGRSLTSLEPLFSYAVTENRDEFGNQYLFGTAPLPLLSLGAPREDRAKVIGQLNEFQHFMASLSPGEDAAISDTVGMEMLDCCAGRAQKVALHFADPVLERNVRELSPATSDLLLAQALIRADPMATRQCMDTRADAHAVK